MKLGVQLFGSMALYNADPSGFLAQLKAAGYTQVEPCAVFGEIPARFGWPAASFGEHLKLAQSFGMTVESVHIFALDFSACTEEIVKMAEAYGISAFVVGFNGPFTEEGVEAFALKCTVLADALRPTGTELWLHNNAAEIRAKVDGVSAYEAVLRRCGGKLGAQVDTGWVVCGREPLAPFLERNLPYLRSIHHKDVVSVTDDPAATQNAPLGLGIVENRAAFDFAEAHGLGQIVDLDNSAGDLLEDLERSAAYLKGLAEQ